MSVVTVLVALLGCRSNGGTATLNVYAAASLTDAFVDLEQAFESQHPGTDVSLTLAGSQVLRLQIEQGAAADVFVSANQTHMDALHSAGHAEPSRILAHNELVVIVPLQNPAGLETFADLARAERIVIGSDNVPVGKYTSAMLERAGASLGATFLNQVRGHIVSEEGNVRLVRAKVELGEADAAIVYRTDASSSERVRAIDIPAQLNIRAAYPIAKLSRAQHPELAAQWMAFVASPAAVAILEKHGFRGP